MIKFLEKHSVAIYFTLLFIILLIGSIGLIVINKEYPADYEDTDNNGRLEKIDTKPPKIRRLAHSFAFMIAISCVIIFFSGIVAFSDMNNEHKKNNGN